MFSLDGLSFSGCALKNWNKNSLQSIAVKQEFKSNQPLKCKATAYFYPNQRQETKVTMEKDQ